MSRRRPQRGVLWVALAASAALHLVIAQPLREMLGQFLFAPPSGPAPPVRVVQLAPEQWSQNLRTKPGVRPPIDANAMAARASSAQPRPSASPSPPPAEDEEKVKIDGRIVDVPPTADETADPNARFLSKNNARVEKETVARIDKVDRKLGQVTNKLQREGSDAPVQTPPRRGAKPKEGDGRADDKEKVEAQDKLVLKVPEILRQEGLDLPRFPGDGNTVAKRRQMAPISGNSKDLDLQLGRGETEKEAEAGGRAGEKGGAGDRPVPSLEVLMPTLGTLDRISGSPREAAIDGVEEGDATFLNAREFKYATYFLRIRDAVAGTWEESLMREFRRRDPTGAVYGTRTRDTQLLVTLRQGGEVQDVKVEGTSGVDFLDKVAVDAFWDAQPFLNPPRGIVDDDGLIRFTFTFRLFSQPQGPFQFRGFGQR